MKRAVLFLAVVVSLAAVVYPLLGVARAQNPVTGEWEFTLDFPSAAQPDQTHTVILEEDGHWYSTEWGMQGYWSRPVAHRITLSGERTVSAGVTEAFAVTGARISGNFDTMQGDFVLWRQPSWSAGFWATGEFKAKRQ